jgi:general secretion pathway protein A
MPVFARRSGTPWQKRTGHFERHVMYAAYFGLKEAPFSITPDPHYLFLGERHREALAHLLFGVGDGGGFVQLTGEVGTGKTTVCRALLEQLPPHVDVALILNPRLTAIELLETVCDELHVTYPPGIPSQKVLVDALYQYLLAAHARGRRTVLVIDEAQNLAIEVLEQIRLLTNLETVHEKLLQIILIGQPELVQLLERRELRQLAQRITARYHLLPFSERETHGYIRHRMTVAGRNETIFSAAALRQVHRASRGVPRLINVICDRALLGAYAQDKDHVDAATVRRAAAEVLGRVARLRSARAWLWMPAVAAGLAGIAIWFVLAPDQRPWMLGAPSTEEAGPAVASIAGPPPLPAVAPPEPERIRTPKLSDALQDPSLPLDKRSAFKGLFARWRLDYPSSATGLACDRARQEGLRCLFKTGDWNRLRRLNLPAILELTTPAGEKSYTTVVALDADRATLAFGERRLTFPLNEISTHWDGFFIVLWRPPAPGTTFIVPGMRGRDVEWVRRRIGDGSVDGGRLPARNRDLYDSELRDRVFAFQRSRSLAPDGVVGDDTLAHLSTASSDPRIPLLSPSRP